MKLSVTLILMLLSLTALSHENTYRCDVLCYLTWGGKYQRTSGDLYLTGEGKNPSRILQTLRSKCYNDDNFKNRIPKSRYFLLSNTARGELIIATVKNSCDKI